MNLIKLLFGGNSFNGREQLERCGHCFGEGFCKHCDDWGYVQVNADGSTQAPHKEEDAA